MNPTSSTTESILQILMLNVPLITTNDMIHYLARRGIDKSEVKRELDRLERRNFVVKTIVNVPPLSGQRVSLSSNSDHESQAALISLLSRSVTDLVGQPTKVVFASPRLLSLHGREPIRRLNNDLIYRYLRIAKAFSQSSPQAINHSWQTAWPRRTVDTVVARLTTASKVGCFVIAPQSMTFTQAGDMLRDFANREDRYVVC